MDRKIIWSENAGDILMELLSEFPTEDRSRVETEARAAAEKVVQEQGLEEVTEDHVLIGLMVATPPFLRDGISKALETRGYDVSSYTKEIDRFGHSEYWG